MKRILHLTLKRHWFDMIANGEKKEEYRTPSPWMDSRLMGKSYDVVRFRNGYSPKSPVINVEYKGYEIGFGNPKWGGSEDKVQVVIKLGKII